MHAQSNKTLEYQNQTVANEVVQERGDSQSAIRCEYHRTEAIQMAKLQWMTHNSS